MNLLEQYTRDPKLLQTLVYRGYNIRFQWDEKGQFAYTTDWPQFDNSEILTFGSNNWLFRQHMKALIDRKQDLIYQFQLNSPYWGAKWAYFDNNGYRDARLTYFKREIAVIPILAGQPLPELPYLQKLAIQLIDKINTAKLQ